MPIPSLKLISTEINKRCCGSGMFILYSGSEYFHTGSRIQVKKISDPRSGSAIKNLSIFRPKNCLGKMIWDIIPDPDFFPSRVPDQGVKKAPDPGYESATL
jgi:hypothetical protein